jgi:hypothetical protein
MHAGKRGPFKKRPANTIDSDDTVGRVISPLRENSRSLDFASFYPSPQSALLDTGRLG